MLPHNCGTFMHNLKKHSHSFLAGFRGKTGTLKSPEI